jgi:PLP dependent protein
MSTIAENIAAVRERISRAADRAGRDGASITLCAVTKTVAPERVAEAVAAGITDLGENYYQEARAKLPLFGPDVRWHFIGHLQSNKARYVAGRFALIQSIGSLRLAVELDRRAEVAGIVQPVLIEVKLDEAEAKSGVDPGETHVLAEQIGFLPHLMLRGLMGMPPLGRAPEESRPYFSRLRGLYEALPPVNRSVLSMGMTADFEIGIEEGATLVRVGTGIFGFRG